MTAVTIRDLPDIAPKPAQPIVAGMDRQRFDAVDVQEAREGAAHRTREHYDETALGVECAWPVAEREALLALT